MLLLPLLANAAPTITVTSPKRNASLTNGVLTATGTAKSTSPITNVSYSLNGGPWASAAGTTNWSVSGLTLTPGSNSFWTYAVDKSGAKSPIDKVSFTYVLDVPLAVSINHPGWGTVNPNDNGKPLQIGESYVMTAKAAKTFGFAG